MQAVSSRAHATVVADVPAHLLAEVADVLNEAKAIQCLEQLLIQLELVFGVGGG